MKSEHLSEHSSESLPKRTRSLFRKPKKVVKHKDPAKAFKEHFIEELIGFKDDADGLRRGYINLQDGWKDKLGLTGMSVTFLAGGAVVSGLAIAGIITGTVSFGIGFVVSLAAIGVEVAYVAYRSKKKNKEFRRASDLLDEDGFMKDAERIADALAHIYAAQLNSCSEKDAERLAESLLKGIKYDLMKNKNLQYEELLRDPSLQNILLRTSKHIPKKQIHLSSNARHNTRSIVKKSALYCLESDQFYSAVKSKPEKYGVLVFETEKDLDDYRSLVRSSKNHKEKWRYYKMNSMEAGMMREGLTFFRQPAVNDRHFPVANDDKLSGSIEHICRRNKK